MGERFWQGATLALIVAGLLAVGSAVFGASEVYQTPRGVTFARFGTPATGAPTKMACTTGADADSGALTADQMYRMICLTDAWVDFGASATNAAADDTYVPAFSPLTFVTNGPQQVLHVSCLSVAVNGACYLTKLN